LSHFVSLLSPLFASKSHPSARHLMPVPFCTGKLSG
jgi:hypothetical protein